MKKFINSLPKLTMIRQTRINSRSTKSAFCLIEQYDTSSLQYADDEDQRKNEYEPRFSVIDERKF
jgi:hypothetical protein